ncbi:tetratricopeptide repeat protein [Roseivirga pacifica]|uniref:tetratricopeptide repeat-containing sensor histidine kinase n=1 Tax=Roseivirga pacifica TaxID=1267423 RepID=UPI003BAE2385
MGVVYKYVIYVEFLLCFTLGGVAQDSLAVANVLEKSKATYFTKRDSSLFYAKQAVDWASVNNDKWQQAWGLKMIGVYYQLGLSYDSAFQYFSSSLELFEEEEDKLEVGKSYLSMAQVRLEQGVFDEALTYNLQAESFFKEIGHQAFLNRVLDAIAQVHSMTGNHELALPYFQRALYLTKLRNDTANLGVANSNLATVFTYLEMADSAEHYFEESWQWLTLIQNYRTLGASYNTLGNLKKSEGDLQAAETHYTDAQRIFEEHNIAIGLMEVYLNQGVLMDTLGRNADAIEKYEASLALARESGNRQLPVLASQRLKLAYAKAGDFRKAFQLSLINDTLKADYMDVEKQKTIATLQTQFETKEKEQQIALQELQIQEQAVKLSRNRILIWAFIIGFVMAVVIVFLLVNRNKKEKALLEQQTQLKLREAEINAVISSQEKERKRFARDLHDGFGQLISVLKLNIDRLRDTDTKANAIRHEVFESGEEVIGEMYAELRNICFDLMPQTLVKHGLEPALKEFGARINTTNKVQCEVMVFLEQKRFSELAEISLFRITQEWINNVLKYSGAQNITIQLTQEDQELTVTVEDDGAGFDPQVFYNGKGNGWKNIQTRVKQIMGEFYIDSRMGMAGTMVTINVPQVAKVQIPISTD